MYENDNDGASSDAFYDDGWTLTLPSGRDLSLLVVLPQPFFNTNSGLVKNVIFSGAKIGHRSLMLYYRQYLRPTDGSRPDVGKAALEKARGLYPALAWTGSTGAYCRIFLRTC